MDALLIVDFQNDFTPGGALAVAEGDLVAGPINELLDSFDLVLASRDWHPRDHGSFVGAEGNEESKLRLVLASTGAEIAVLTVDTTDEYYRTVTTLFVYGQTGYEVVTLNDCVAATSIEEHENAIAFDYPMFSKPMNSEEFLSELD